MLRSFLRPAWFFLIVGSFYSPQFTQRVAVFVCTQEEGVSERESRLEVMTKYCELLRWVRKEMRRQYVVCDRNGNDREFQEVIKPKVWEVKVLFHQFEKHAVAANQELGNSEFPEPRYLDEHAWYSLPQSKEFGKALEQLVVVAAQLKRQSSAFVTTPRVLPPWTYGESQQVRNKRALVAALKRDDEMWEKRWRKQDARNKSNEEWTDTFFREKADEERFRKQMDGWKHCCVAMLSLGIVISSATLISRRKR